jgi:hypothetical protein
VKKVNKRSTVILWLTRPFKTLYNKWITYRLLKRKLKQRKAALRKADPFIYD